MKKILQKIKKFFKVLKYCYKTNREIIKLDLASIHIQPNPFISEKVELPTLDDIKDIWDKMNKLNIPIEKQVIVIMPERNRVKIAEIEQRVFETAINLAYRIKEGTRFEIRSDFFMSLQDNEENFCKKISDQQDCPKEFIDLVNKEFWNLI